MLKDDILNYSKGWNTSGKAEFDKDFVYRGEVGKVLLGEAVDKGDLLYPVITSLGTVAEWKQSDASIAATMPAKCMALEDGSDATYCKVLFRGYVKDKDFSYSTEATGTFVQTAIIAEGDRMVIDEDCFQWTTAKGTTSAAKIAATGTFSTSGVPVNGQIVTIDTVVFEITEGEDIASSSDFAIDCTAALSQAVFETAFEAALDQAIAAGALDISYADFTGNDCVITLGGAVDSYVGLEQNDVVSTEDCTNAAWGSGTFLGGVPAVNWWVLNVATEATQKTLFMAQIDLAIAAGLQISYVDFTGGGANDNLVMTSLKKGYEGNYIDTVDFDSAGTNGSMSNGAVSQALFSGGVEGGRLWTSESKGLMTLTKPVADRTVKIQDVGYAIEAEKYFFNPQPIEDEYKGVAITSPVAAGITNTGTTNEFYQFTDPDSGDLITDIFIDITGLIAAGNSARDAIGTAAASYLLRFVASDYGYVHHIEMTCLELPAGGGTTVDIDLEEEASGTLQKDGACSDTVLIAAGGWAVGKKVVANITPTANYYLYFTEGDTNGDDSVFTAGQFKIRMRGNACDFGVPA